jgi:hypothetical protein
VLLALAERVIGCTRHCTAAELILYYNLKAVYSIAMANPQMEHWFRLADEDRDGGVGGAEAVRFFTKSGLPQEVLGQVIHDDAKNAFTVSSCPSTALTSRVSLCWLTPASDHCFASFQQQLKLLRPADLGVCIWWRCQAQYGAVCSGDAAGSAGAGARVLAGAAAAALNAMIHGVLRLSGHTNGLL